MRIEVLPYSPSWPLQFDKLKMELEGLVGEVSYMSIEHVGSTSVPGLAAKPIIDIDIIISREHLQDTIEALTKADSYAYMGEWGVPDRHAFRQPNAPIRHNLYVCIEGCQSLRNHLAVRDMCREHPEIRDRYGKLKLELAKQEWENMDEYGQAKSELLGWILEKAGMNEKEVKEIGKLNKKVE